MVMQFIRNEECPADFLITGGGKDIFVRLRRAVPFLQTIGDLEAEFRELIRQLRCIPGYREFWIYSKKDRCGSSAWRIPASWNSGRTDSRSSWT
jgi:hypothetical protein